MATKRSCCCSIRFSCFSSSSSDEKEQDHPTSGAGAPSSPSATDNTIETLPGAPKRTEPPIPGPSNVVTPMKNEIEHVDVNINVSGTHQCGKAPVSESLNLLRKSEGKNVNVNLNVPEAPQCNEASSSGSSNVPDRSDREDVNANLNVSGATQCDEAPSSGSPNVPGKSEGEGVDANLNVLGAPLSNEAPSSSSSSSTSTSKVATKSDVIDTILHKDIVQTDGKNVAVNLDDLMKHISELLKLREEEMRRGKKLPNPSSNFSWPNVPGFKKLNDILSLGTDLKKLTELLSSGLEVASKLKDIISGPVTELLKGLGQASIFTAGLLVVANTLETFQDLSSNQQQCLDLLKEMSYFATIVKRFRETPRETQNDVIQDAVTLIVEGAILCCTNMERSAWKSFFSASKEKGDLSGMRQKLDVKYKQIDIEIGLRLSTDFERVFAAIAARDSPLSNKYPKHAVGIEESIEEVMERLECDSEKNVVIVILHGFGGIGKTTLADAVFSKVEGCKYSKVQLFKDIDTKPDIVKLQEDILKDLMETQGSVQIRKYEDGQKELGKILKERPAFIYIDNVLDPDELEHLLPESEDLHEAKKVRFLLTARDKNAKLAFPSSVSTQIYDMKGIKNRQAARSILEKENMEGLDSSKLDQIINKCDGLPLLLKLVARFIGHAGDKGAKGAAYDQLMQEEEIWNNEKFKEMSLRLAYDALPKKCKDPFLDICSYFRRWDWDIVENIVGKNELEMLENRALVTKDTFTGVVNAVVNVHDVILELGMSKGKEVRLTFSSAWQLMACLEEKKESAEGIKGIWLSGNKDVLRISASTLDSMHKSLRVLQLGDLTEVEGKCSKKFEELVFFEAKLRQLPFDNVSNSKQLRYLSYPPNELKLSQMPPSLRHMEFDGSSHSYAFQISSMDLRRHKDLRILRLVNFSEKLTNLPKEFGDQVTCLRELSLSNCKSIKKLPDSISKLRYLRILEMDNCSNLTELPVDFGSLSSLQELNLAGCMELKALPDSIDKLSLLKVLNLSDCNELLNLPSGLGKLTCLVELSIESCGSLENIPENIGELKQLRVMNMTWCDNLKELPDGFCNLSFITRLSLLGCSSLEKLPDRFGQLKSLKVLDMTRCRTLEKLPEGFGQLKNLEGLDLEDCSELRELCNDFHCLSSLQQLDLKDCESLEKLPEDFHFLNSLQRLHLNGCKRLEKLPEYFRCLNSLRMLDLRDCPKLEAKSMDHVTKMNTLQFVNIIGSDELVQRWAGIQSDGHESSSLSVMTLQEVSISENDKENTKNSVLSELGRLLTNGRGEPIHLSDLLPNTSALLIFDLYDDPDKDRFPWPLIEETVDDGMQIKIIYIGPHFEQLPKKVKDTIFVVHQSKNGVPEILAKLFVTIGFEDQYVDHNCFYLLMDTKMVRDGNSANCRPSSVWRFLTKGEVEEFVVCNCGRYLRLKQLAETNQESNIELLIELFAHEGDETTPVFQKNESSQKDPTENSERKTTCGVDKLEGKTILVELWPSHSWRCEINHPFWKEMYFMEKEKVDLEIISIPIVYPSEECDVIDVYKQFSRQVPWLVLQNSWTVITRAVKFFFEKFFEKHCEWEEPDECEKWYPTITWIIEPKGRISVYRPYRFLKEEWEQPKNMSTLEFLFNHSESVSAQVRKLMLPGKLICLYRVGHDDQVIYTIWNALEQQQRDSIHIIHLGRRRMESFKFTNSIKKDYYYPLKNTAEIEGMSSLNLSESEILRFSLRLCRLEEETNRMEDSELKFLLRSFREKSYMRGSIAFMDGGGKVVAALGGKDLHSILLFRQDIAQRFIKSIMNDIEGGGKEMHHEDAGVFDSLIQNLQTTAAAAVEQQNVDAYFESLREYISELWGMELSQHFRFNKEGKKPSLPMVIWPTSRGFCRLKNSLSEGINDDWVKDIISRHPDDRAKPAIVIHSLLKDIEEAQWAVAALLAVANVFERFQTSPAKLLDCMFLLWEMLRAAQYIKQFDQMPGLWRGVKRVATAIIVAYSFHCCSEIDESKFAWFSDTWNYDDKHITKICDMMAEAITGGPSNEWLSPSENMSYYFYAFSIFLESEDGSGPSSEGESGVSAVEAGSTGIDEGGPSCEGESDVSAGSTGIDEGGPSCGGESDVSAFEAGSTTTTGEEE